jgi:hypothetical protein
MLDYPVWTVVSPSADGETVPVACAEIGSQLQLLQQRSGTGTPKGSIRENPGVLGTLSEANVGAPSATDLSGV